MLHLLFLVAGRVQAVINCWESLSNSRWSRRLIQLYKIYNMTPDYLFDRLPSLRASSNRNINTHSYQELMFNTSRYQNSFSPDLTKLWNNKSEFSSAPSIAIFKRNIINLIRPKLVPGLTSMTLMD